MPWVFLVTMTDVRWAIVLFSIAFFGQQSWSTLVMTLPADLFPRRLVGSVAGLVGFGGAMGGVASNFIFGRVLDALQSRRRTRPRLRNRLRHHQLAPHPGVSLDPRDDPPREAARVVIGFGSL